mmetsp:Transcript_20713/g.46691  ORF Transcript_20713/g.46691 Transcript_20713/m.46691 type:complete len:117 (+) Transcript_20713:1687-2037(+)
MRQLGRLTSSTSTLMRPHGNIRSNPNERCACTRPRAAQIGVQVKADTVVKMLGTMATQMTNINTKNTAMIPTPSITMARMNGQQQTPLILAKKSGENTKVLLPTKRSGQCMPTGMR